MTQTRRRQSTKPARATKVDAVFAELRERILSEGLRVDDPLPPERALAVEFGVSRHVVREALGRLKAMGLLTARTKRGTRLATTCL